jgi:bis(5'-nucleosyl)-tetraphosphatase (symmetrical)
VRRIFIGDIQGCAQALEELIDRVGLRPDDRLWCVGDLVNRGPDSLAVLRRLRGLGARTVLGNHDLHLLHLAATRAVLPHRHPLASVLPAPDVESLLAWLREQPVMHVERDFVVVHGGLHPAWRDLPAVAAAVNAAVPSHLRGVVDDRIVFATEVRYCDAEGRRPPTDEPPPGPPFAPWDHFYQGERWAVFGHWARRGLVVAPRRRGLDTGCVYGGTLTAWVAEEDRLVQVPGRHAGR